MEADASISEFDPYTYEGSPNVDIKHGYLAALCGLVFFFAINFAAIKIGPPKNVTGDIWRWRNTFVSWVHADIIGLGVLYCFMYKPEISTDLILYCDTFIYCFVAFSYGYFVYDFLDYAINKRAISNYEVILHHICVLWPFGYNLYYKVNVPYCIIALMVEVNSIFLHGRKLMHFDKWPFQHWLYKTVVALNLITFVRYRLWGVILVCWGVYTDWRRLTLFYQMFVSISMVAMYVINQILFWRLLKNDVLRHYRSTGKKERPVTNGTSEKLLNGECHKT